MPKRRPRTRGVFPEKPPMAESEQDSARSKDEDPGVGGEHLRITVYATMDQLYDLDHARITIRRATRRVLERTAIIRGLIEGWRRSGIDFAALGIATEEEVADLIAGRLGLDVR